MNDNKNIILAVVLSMIVLLGWSWLSERYFPTANPPATKIEDGRPVPTPQPQASAVPNAPAAMRERAAVLRESPRVAIRTPRLAGSINLRGARIDDLVLTRERETIAADSPPVRLFSPAGARGAYFAGFGWTGQGIALPGPDTVWQASGAVLSPGSPVTLSWNNGQGQVFQIRLSVDDGYLFSIEQNVVNRGAGAVGVQPFSLVNRTGPSPDVDAWTAHVGPMGVFDGSADYDNDYGDIAAEGERGFDSRGGWLGFTDKYWLAAVIPDQASPIRGSFRHNAPTDAFQADYSAPLTLVAPGRGARYRSHLFAGVKEVRLLQAYSDTLGTPVERAIDWGWFRWFMIPIFSLLIWLYAQIGNFGVAIISLTLIVRTILFPIAQKQFQSMAKMRVLQPKMKAIQERYGDDRMKIQEETMKLYREEKANPLAGCLPIFLQIPVFYALFKVLSVSVEMRHQPFYLWIRDLTAPDPLTPVNLFGLLPFTPPSILAIGILPILVGVTMWLQMRMQPQMPDPVQRQIFAMMPWVLTVMMASFAAGFQLYWLTNNLLSIGQMRLLQRRYPLPKAEPAAPPPPAQGGGGKAR